MRRRELHELNLQDILDIHFDCADRSEVFSVHGYDPSKFYVRLRKLGLDEFASSHIFGNGEDAREIIFSLLLETEKNVNKVATILDCSYKYVANRVFRYGLTAPLNRALEESKRCD
jgi:hypothetical protein